jgi:hypothetical protein
LLAHFQSGDHELKYFFQTLVLSDDQPTRKMMLLSISIAWGWMHMSLSSPNNRCRVNSTSRKKCTF